MDTWQPAARMSVSIRVITASVLVMAGVIAVASLKYPAAASVAALLVALCAGSYVLAPVGYQLSDRRLTVYSCLRAKRFEDVVRCAPMDRPLPWWATVRLFGNGGLFAGMGWFWNRALGVFRAYVTSARTADLVLVETATQKILISPRDARAFVEAWRASLASA